MKRALLVTAGTVAGLVSVLAYSPLDPATTVLSEGSGGGPGLGAPPAASPVAAAEPDAASAAPADPSTPGSTRRAAAHPTSVRSRAGRPVARPRPATRPSASSTSSAPQARPTPHPTARSTSASSAPTRVVSRRSSSPAPTHTTTPHLTPSPTPKPSPTPVGPKDYTGSAVTYKYGTLQVAIRVVGGHITDAWAVTYPMGTSKPYSEMAIPILRSQTISAQSAHIAGATGASLTSASWITSLSAAIASAGLR